jgi:hypothetical protein
MPGATPDISVNGMGSGFEAAAQAGKLTEGLQVPDVNTSLAGQLESVSLQDAGPTLADLARGSDVGGPGAGTTTAVGTPDGGRPPVPEAFQQGLANSDLDPASAQITETSTPAQESGSTDATPAASATPISTEDASAARVAQDEADSRARVANDEADSAARVAGTAEPTSGSADSTADGASASTEAPPQQAASEVNNSADADKSKRVAELQGKIDNGTITRDEYSEYKGLQQDPEKRRAELQEKAKQGTLTPEEETEFFDGKAEGTITPEDEDIPDTETESPETIAQTLDEAQEQFFKAVENGDLKAMEEAANKYNEDLARIQGYTMTDADKAKAAELLRGIFKAEGNQAESPRYRHIRQKLQELGQLEMQVHQLARAVAQMKKTEDEIKTQVNSAEDNYVSESNPTEKAKKYQAFAVTSLRLAQYQESIKQQKGRGRDLSLKRRQVRGYMHRKLGTKNAAYNVIFGTGTAMMQGAYAGINAAGDVSESIFDM